MGRYKGSRLAKMDTEQILKSWTLGEYFKFLTLWWKLVSSEIAREKKKAFTLRS